MKVEVDREPFLILNNEFVKPGKGQAFNRMKMKNMVTGRVVEKTYKSGDKLTLADVEEKKMRYLYHDGEGGVFMDDVTFDQMTISDTVLQDNRQWLKEEVIFDIVFYKGNIIEATPPTFMELLIQETAPGVRGDTSGRAMKPATTETGAKIQVPIFIEEGEVVKIDTRDSSYVSRA
jgi:elongation factor P